MMELYIDGEKVDCIVKIGKPPKVKRGNFTMPPLQPFGVLRPYEAELAYHKMQDDVMDKLMSDAPKGNIHHYGKKG